MSFIFFFNSPPTTEIYTLSLHDALPISHESRFASRYRRSWSACRRRRSRPRNCPIRPSPLCRKDRSEEHTSELQSRRDLVCRLLLEKKKKTKIYTTYYYNMWMLVRLIVA